MNALPIVRLTRYATPLREGGSLPGIVEGADDGTYVCKFRGAGQGLRVLVAEVIVAVLAQRLGLHTPRQVVLDLSPEIARYEADEEVQDLLVASVGHNLGIDFLPGSFGFDSAQIAEIEPLEAAKILWLDAFTANVDRSWRNPNLLVWHGQTWVIDHGASLYFHHGWAGGITDPERFARQPWDATGHVMGTFRRHVPEADTAARALITEEVLTSAVATVPDEWLEPVAGTEDAAALRATYVRFLTARLGSQAWLPVSDS